MTGEMGWNELKDYPDMLALAKKIQSDAKVAAEVRPFDVYQGPYIAVNLSNTPLRKKGIQLLGSWNAEVWYGEHPKTFVIEYKNKFSPAMFPEEIIDHIISIKKSHNKVIAKSTTKSKMRK